MATIGIIPARKGSKRIPNKNLKPLLGKPLIQYTIEAALKSKFLDKVIVSTDSEEIASLSKNLGASVPFMRPEELSGDKSTDFDVLNHAVNWLQENEEIEATVIVYLRPTTPLKTPSIIDQAIIKAKDKKYTGLRSVTKTDGVFHPYWMYFDNNKLLTAVVQNIELKDFFQSQLLPNCYRLNGVVDIVKKHFMSKDALYGEEVGFVEVEEKLSIDIDTNDDFEYCEYILNKMERNNE